MLIEIRYRHRKISKNKKLLKIKLNVDCRSWLHINYLQNSSLEIHALWIIELTIVYPYVVVLVAYHIEAEFPIQRIAAGPFCAD